MSQNRSRRSKLNKNTRSDDSNDQRLSKTFFPTLSHYLKYAGELFPGRSYEDWVYQCPRCLGLQRGQDFLELSDSKLMAAMASQQCIKRYKIPKKKKQRCAQISYTQPKGPVRILKNGKSIWIFRLYQEPLP